MTEIQEEILLSYFPEYLDTQMLKFIELKFKLEEELEKLTGWNAKKNDPTSGDDANGRNGPREEGEQDSSVKIFWNLNTIQKITKATELKEQVSKMISKNISTEIVKAKKAVKVKNRGLVSNEVEWVDCDKYGNLLDSEMHKTIIQESQVSFRFADGSHQDQSRIFGASNHLNTSQSENPLEMSKETRIVYLVNSVRELSKKESKRIFEIYFNKPLDQSVALDYFKISLALFGKKVGAKEIANFFKLKLVSIVFLAICNQLEEKQPKQGAQ